MGWGDILVGRCLLHIPEDLSLNLQCPYKDGHGSGSLQSQCSYGETKGRACGLTRLLYAG